MRFRALALPAVLLVALSGCGAAQKSNSAASFNGPKKDVAQTIDALSTAATKSDGASVCTKLLARSLVTKLDRASGGCKKVLDDQLGTTDTPMIKVNSVTVNGSTATAQVTSKVNGTDARRTLTLVREGGRWRISGIR